MNLYKTTHLKNRKAIRLFKGGWPAICLMIWQGLLKKLQNIKSMTWVFRTWLWGCMIRLFPLIIKKRKHGFSHRVTQKKKKNPERKERVRKAKIVRSVIKNKKFFYG